MTRKKRKKKSVPVVEAELVPRTERMPRANYEDVLSRCRSISPMLVDELIKIALLPVENQTLGFKLKAIDMIHNRAWGKPTEYHQHEMSMSREELGANAVELAAAILDVAREQGTIGDVVEYLQLHAGESEH